MKKHLVVAIFVALILALTGCDGDGPAPTEPPLSVTPTSIAEQPTTAPASPTPCALEPLVTPTMPAEIPGYVQLDEATGLHMTGDVQQLDVVTWRLEITGTVQTPLSLTYDDLRCMPKIEQSPILICPGFFQDEATWAGASLAYILELAGAPASFSGIMLSGADGYYTFVSQQALNTGQNFLAYEWEGEPLPILHGFPVRAVFPALDGNKWVKWLLQIEVQ